MIIKPHLIKPHLIKPDLIIEYWFSEENQQYWFASTPEIDAQMRAQFNDLWESAKSGELDHWKESATGCLALCIVLDQLPLNMFRDTPKSFSTEQQSIEVAKYAIKNGLDQQIDKGCIAFLYMPLMHSENLDDQNLSVSVFEKTGLEGNIRFAKHHRDLIKTYGRFPHRNEILDRENTVEEREYLNSKHAFTG